MMERRAAKAPGLWCLAVAMVGMVMISPATARDAAFMQPSASNSGGEEEAVKVEPKSEIDVGDTTIHVTRRTTLFFVNASNTSVQVDKMSVNSDANVEAELTNDDCSKQGSIAPQSRCSVEVSVTPSSSGAWSVEALMTHNGAGRIARAKLNGKTAGGVSEEKKESGLAVASSKETTQVDFGSVDVGGKAARSALMVNDSPDPITLYSIDVIEADNGLKVLEGGGCAVDMELKSGESCPVTIIWEPVDEGQISTDLIIRHSGRKGFAVVPVRGKTKDYGTADSTSKPSDKTAPATTVTKNGALTPLTADELDKQMSGKIPPMSADALDIKPVSSATLRLIGTVGNRAVILLPDGTSKIVDLDDEIPLGDDRKAKVVSIDAKSVKISIDGKEKTLHLEAASDLIAKAVAAHEKSNASTNAKDGKDSKSSAQKTSTSSTPLPGAGSKGASP